MYSTTVTLNSPISYSVKLFYREDGQERGWAISNSVSRHESVNIFHILINRVRKPKNIF